MLGKAHLLNFPIGVNSRTVPWQLVLLLLLLLLPGMPVQGGRALTLVLTAGTPPT
jgi:hypothetical protein